MPQTDRGMSYYIQILLRNWWLVLGVPALVGGLVMFLAPFSEPVTVYQAQSRVLVQASPGGAVSADYDSTTLASLYKELIKEPDVLAEVARTLQLKESPQALDGQITLKVIVNTPILSVQVTSGNPGQAVAIANALPEAFIRQTQDRNLTRAAQLLSGASSLGIADQGQILSQQLAAQGSITIIRRAQEAAAEQVAAPKANPTIAVVLAIMAVLGAVIGRELLKDRVYSPENLGSRLGIEPLGVVPSWRPSRSRGHKPITVEHPDGVHAEAYRHVIAGLLSTGPLGGHPPRVIVVTSPGSGEGKTTSTVNLAIAAAQTGRKVLVVDADLWRPDIYRWFFLSDTVGLTNLLVKPHLPLESVIRPSPLPNLSVITAGPHAGKGFRTLDKGALETLLNGLREQAELVIIDTPPFLARSDTLWLAAKADEVVIVADADKTRIRDLKAVIHSIERLKVQNTRLHMSMMVNRFQPPKVVYYSYYRYFGSYASYYGGYKGAYKQTKPAPSGWLKAKAKERSNRDQ